MSNEKKKKITIKRVNLEKFKSVLTKDNLKRGAFIVIMSSILGGTILSCNGCSEGRTPSKIEQTTDNNKENETTPNIDVTTPTEEPTTPAIESTAPQGPTTNVENETTQNTDVTTPTEEPTTQEVVIEKLDVETFNKFVDELEIKNAEDGFNIRRENLELLTYIQNMHLATPELIDKIHSEYEYNNKLMFNTYMQAVNQYNCDKLDFYNGKDEKYAKLSNLSIDEIDRETMEYIELLTDNLYTSAQGTKRSEFDIANLNGMVQMIMKKNEELGIELSKTEVEMIVYEYNYKQATEVVRKYIELNVPEGQTQEGIANNVLNILKAHNKASKKDFDLSLLEYESYSMADIIKKLESYLRENGTILGNTKDNLTIGGFGAIKLKVDHTVAYLDATGYATQYKDSINAIQAANIDAFVSRLYAALDQNASLVNCQEEKVNTLTK